MSWQRVTATNHSGCESCGRHTVFWRHEAPDGWLTVSPPRYSPNRVGWSWKRHRRHETRPKSGPATIVAAGSSPTVTLAKRAALASVESCPHGCGFLQWADDQWICPRCGDEWDADTIAAGLEEIAQGSDAGADVSA